MQQTKRRHTGRIKQPFKVELWKQTTNNNPEDSRPNQQHQMPATPRQPLDPSLSAWYRFHLFLGVDRAPKARPLAGAQDCYAVILSNRVTYTGCGLHRSVIRAVGRGEWVASRLFVARSSSGERNREEEIPCTVLNLGEFSLTAAALSLRVPSSFWSQRTPNFRQRGCITVWVLGACVPKRTCFPKPTKKMAFP